MKYIRDKKILLTVYFLFYYSVFGFFFINHMLLSEYRPIFFNYNRDLSELFLIATGLPRFMIGHPWAFAVADSLLYIIPAVLLWYYIRKGQFSMPAGVLFTAFLVLYLLLANLFIQCHLEPYVLYLLLSLAFLTNREDRFYDIIALSRYYFLYIFVSAAIWKISRGAIFNLEEMSNIILSHHSDVLYTNDHSLSGAVYFYLIDHPGISYWVYLSGVALEASFAIGFFTRRFDRILLGFVALFLLFDVLIMRIPYWTILLGAITLLPDFGRKKTLLGT